MPKRKVPGTVARIEDIAALAYRYYEEDGRPDGRAEEHWRRAETELRGSRPSEGVVLAPKAKKVSSRAPAKAAAKKPVAQ